MDTNGVLTPGPDGGCRIVAQMLDVMRKVGAIAKDSRYEQGLTKFSYRGVDGVVQAVGPILREVGVLPVVNLRSIEHRDTRTTGGKDTRETTLVVEYRLFAEDGSSMLYTIPGENLNMSDKGTAAAMSVAYRVLWLQALCVPTDEPDPDSSYLTREGRGEMSPAQQEMIGSRLATAPVGEFPQLWAVVVDHAAADRPSVVNGPDDSPLTWYGAFGAALAGRIAAVRTPDQYRTLQAEIRAAGNGEALHWAHEGERPGDRFRARAVEIRDNQKLAVDVYSLALEQAWTPEAIAEVEGRWSAELGALNGRLYDASELTALAKARLILIGTAPEGDATGSAAPVEPTPDPVNATPASPVLGGGTQHEQCTYVQSDGKRCTLDQGHLTAHARVETSGVRTEDLVAQSPEEAEPVQPYAPINPVWLAARRKNSPYHRMDDGAKVTACQRELAAGLIISLSEAQQNGHTPCPRCYITTPAGPTEPIGVPKAQVKLTPGQKAQEFVRRAMATESLADMAEIEKDVALAMLNDDLRERVYTALRRRREYLSRQERQAREEAQEVRPAPPAPASTPAPAQDAYGALLLRIGQARTQDELDDVMVQINTWGGLESGERDRLRGKVSSRRTLVPVGGA